MHDKLFRVGVICIHLTAPLYRSSGNEHARMLEGLTAHVLCNEHDKLSRSCSAQNPTMMLLGTMLTVSVLLPCSMQTVSQTMIPLCSMFSETVMLLCSVLPVTLT